MRFDVQTIRRLLTAELLAAPQVREIWHEGEDVVLLDLKSGETIAIHFIIRPQPLGEIRKTFIENEGLGFHTLLIFWADMLLPADGQLYDLDDWMHALLALHGGHVYGYDAFRGHVGIFPVTFEHLWGNRYRTHHGEKIAGVTLAVETVNTDVHGMEGRWRVATFAPRDGAAQPAGARPQEEWATPPRHADAAWHLRASFGVLGLATDANRAAVRDAYRQLARRYHPDLNSNADATAHMQRINEAYAVLLRHFDGGKV